MVWDPSPHLLRDTSPVEKKKEPGGIGMNTNYFTQQLETMMSENCVDPSHYGLNIVYREFDQKISELDQKSWAIFGGGGNFGKFYEEFIRNKQRKNLNCILDNDPNILGTQREGLTIFSPASLLQQNIEAVCIIVSGYSEEITTQLKTIKPDLHIFHLIDEFDHCAYLDSYPIIYFRHFYLSIHLDRIKHREETDPVKKKFLLETIISSYLTIRDFETAFIFLETHKKEYNDPKYIALTQKLEHLLEELQTELSKRTQPDICLLFLDCLTARASYQSPHMPFFNKLKDNGVYYENCHSAGVFTVESTHTIFHETYGPENESNHHAKPASASRLIQHLKQEGYESNSYYSLVPGSQLRTDLNQNLYKDPASYAQSVYNTATPFLFWEMITHLSIQKGKQFNIVHTLQETHPPYASAYHDLDLPVISLDGVEHQEEQESLFIKQYNEALQYADRQLAFYLSMMPKQSMQVISGDHGVFKKYKKTEDDVPYMFLWYSHFHHVPLVISGCATKPQKISPVFSLIHLTDLLVSLVQTKEIPSIEKGFARLDFVGYVNKTFQKNATKLGLADHVNGFNCVFDETHKLVRCGNGAWHYYDLRDEAVEITDKTTQQEIYDKLYPFLEATDVV